MKRPKRRITDLILETVPEAIAWKDVNSVYQGANTKFAKVAGLNSAEEVVGKTDEQLSWKAYAEEYAISDQKVLNSEKPSLHMIEHYPGKDSYDLWIDVSLLPLLNKSDEKVGVLIVFRDITDSIKEKQKLKQLLKELSEKNAVLQSEISERKKLEVKLDHMAMYDALTNLPNRLYLMKESHKQLSAAKRYGHRIAFLFVDLDGFKAVNDNQGHETGDAVLVEMSSRMTRAVRDNDLVTRYGGDEFIIVLPGCKSNTDIKLTTQRILQEIRKPLSSLNIEEKLSASIGIAVYPENSDNSDELISLADKAMYQAKHAGKNQFRFS